MNISFIKQYADLQFEEAAGLPPEEVGRQLLMLADYLLEQVEQEPGALGTGSDEKALHKSFLQCSKMARRLSEFADQYGTETAERTKGALETIRTCGQKLEDMQEESERCVQLTQQALDEQEKVQSANAELLGQQAELEQQQRELEELRRKVEELTAVRERILNAGDEARELEALLEANNRIAEAIQKSGYVADDRSDPDSFYVRVETLSRQAQEISEQYNALLRDVLTDAKAVQDAISSRQEPGYGEDAS